MKQSSKSIANKDIFLSENSSYNQAGLHSYISRSYLHMGYTHPTPIQYHSIYTYIQHHPTTIIAQSKSGTGKTLSYISIILTHILTQPILSETCTYLIIVPTRQLSLQVYQIFKEILLNFTKVKADCPEQIKSRQLLKKIKLMMSIGGLPFEDDKKKYLSQGGNVFIGTIGRILQFIDKKLIKVNQLNMLILDEGDKLFQNKNKKFSDILQTVLTLKHQDKYSIQLLIYSATYSSKFIHQIFKKRELIFIQTLMDNESNLQVRVTGKIQEMIVEDHKQQVQNVQASIINLNNIKKYKMIISSQGLSFFNAKIQALIRLLQELEYERCLVFVEKKTLLQLINQKLIENKIEAILIHGSLSQSSRIKLMNQINSSKIIIASDLLARGIDIELDLVILFDAKLNDTFWHRIGRTGRYDKMGVAVGLDNVQGWQEYDCSQVQANLDEIKLNFNKSKEWYGKYLTEVGMWNETNPQKQIQLSKQYKYFDQSIIVQQKHPSLPQTQHHLQQLPDLLSQISSIKNQQDLASIILKIDRCKQCKQFIQRIEELTGYQFQIKRYIP